MGKEKVSHFPHPGKVVVSPHVKDTVLHLLCAVLYCIQNIVQLFSFLLFVISLRPLIEDSKVEVHLHRTEVIMLII